MFKRHPKGLPVLFFTEMWERFGFYLMLGIFTLYMIDPTSNGGMGFSDFKAADIYGTYLALVYLTPFLGGLLADKVLGYRKAISIGGFLMGCGYIGLSLHGEIAFYLSLLLIIIGNGFFKPNISTLVGKLYDNNDNYRPYKDSGFNIFYMGINIGAFVCNFVAAYLRHQYGWGYAFAIAGIGMFIGLIWFWFGQKHVKEADVISEPTKDEMPLGKLISSIFGPAILAGVIGWFVPQMLFGQPLLGANSTDAFLFAAIPFIGYFIMLWAKAPKEEKNPIGALLSVFAVVIIFWAVFHQNGSALTIWAERYTDRSMPAAVETVAENLHFAQEVSTTREVPQVDAHGVPVTDESGKVISTMEPDPYFNNLPKEEWPAEGQNLKLISTEIFQSINPFFVVFLTPLVVGFWNMMRRKKKEPSTPGKIGIGMLITALSTTIMMIAVITSDNGVTKSLPWWLVINYGVITVGELCLSPMGLSLVSKLSPKRVAGLMMGGWFFSTALGNKLSGVLSGLWGSIDNKVYFFMINFAGALVGAILMFVLLKWIKRIVEEHTGSH